MSVCTSLRLYVTLDNSSVTRRVVKQLAALGARAIVDKGNRVFFEAEDAARFEELQGVERLCLCLFDVDLGPDAPLFADHPADWSVLEGWFESADMQQAAGCWKAIRGRPPASWALNARRRGEACRKCIDQQELLTRARACVQRHWPSLSPVRYSAGEECEDLPDLAVQLQLSTSGACAGVPLLRPSAPGAAAPHDAPQPKVRPPPPPPTPPTSLFALNLRPPTGGALESADAAAAREVAWWLRALVRRLESEHEAERKAAQRHARRGAQNARRQLRALETRGVAAAATPEEGGGSSSSDGGGGGGAWARLAPLLLPLPVPCVYCDPSFLDAGAAARWLAALEGEQIRWVYNPRRAQRATAVYGDGVRRPAARTPGAAAARAQSAARCSRPRAPCRGDDRASRIGTSTATPLTS